MTNRSNSFKKNVILGIVSIILTSLLYLPLPYGNYGVLYFGFFPAPFAHWIFSTILYICFIVYLAFVYDPYSWLNDEDIKEEE